MSRYWEIETRLDDNTNITGNGDLDYEVYGQIAILLNKYVRKEEGKGLSTNDFTDEYRKKLDEIEDKAQVNVLETISVNGGEKLYPDEEKNIDIFVPTKTSEIENDSDFAVTSEDTTFTENVTVEKDLNVNGDLIVSGTSTLDDTDINGNLNVSDDLTVNGETSLKNTNIDGTTIISGNTTVHGDLYVDGVTHTTTEEQINTTADTIVLRQNNPTSLGSTYSGIVINHYNGTNELALVTDSDGTLRLGTGVGSETLYQNIYWDDTTEKWYSDSTLETEVTPQGSLTSWESFETIGDIKHYTNAIFTVINFDGLVPIMCRDEDIDMNNDAILKWNSTDRVARTIDNPTLDGQILTYKYKPSTSTTVYTDGINFYNADGTSTIQPSGTSGTPTSIGQFVNYNNLWYTKNTDWYLVDDFSDNTNWTVVSDQTTIDNLELETAVEISSVVYTTTMIKEYSWELSNSAGVSFIGTRAEYNVAKLIPVGTVGHIPSGSLVILTDETDYLNSEDR